MRADEMSIALKPKNDSKTRIKFKRILEFAHTAVGQCADSTEFFNVIFGTDGKANELLPNAEERRAFLRSEECKAIRKLRLSLPKSTVKNIEEMNSKGPLTVSLQLPRSVYDSLVAEAVAERVSLDQLCLAKLLAQLRDVV